MSQPMPSGRHDAALRRPTGYRRVVSMTFTRALREVTLEPTSLSITQDARRAMRWSATAEFVDRDYQPDNPSDLLAPFGTTVRISVGLELTNGTRSLVPMGVYAVNSATTSTDANGHTTSVTLVDLADAVDRYRFESPVTIASGTDLGTLVNIVVASRTGTNPAVPLVGRSLTSTRVMGLDPETGPWAELRDILRGFGYVAWYDRNGQVRVGLESSTAANPYELTGPVSRAAAFDSRPYNVVVVRAEPPDGTPMQAVAWDNDPGSPTFAGDSLSDPPSTPYGRVTRFYSTQMAMSSQQAAEAATALLAQSLGGGASETITLPFDPTVDVNDVVSLGGRTFVVDCSTVNLTGETTLVVRRS